MFSLELSAQAEKFIAKVQRKDNRLFRRFILAFNRIVINPFEAKRLTGELEGLNSYRVGDYRIVFEINSQEQLVSIITIEHRKDVYR